MSAWHGARGAVTVMADASVVSARRVSGAQLVGAVSLRRRIAVMVTVAVVVSAAVAGITASSSSAFDEVWLNNESNANFTEGSLCILVGSVSCSDFPEWEEGSVLKAGQANPGIELLLNVVTSPIDFTDKWETSGVSGVIKFVATDPVIGPANVECYGEGNVGGFSCSVADHLYAYIHGDTGATSGLIGSSPSADVGFASGVAKLSRRGVAMVSIESYSRLGHGSVRERVVLHGSKGRELGHGEKTVQFGQRTEIAVPLPSDIAKTVAHAKKGLEVQASVEHADATQGTGETTKVVLAG